MSLKSETITGTKWSSIAQFGRQLLFLCVTVILARILGPKDFGLMSMAMVVIGFIDLFKDFGTAAAVVQKKIITNALLNSLFWMNVVIGLVATFLLFVFSTQVSFFYHEPQLTNILKLLSITFIFSGLSVLPNALFQKKLNFNLLAKAELFSSSAGAVVGVCFAYYGAGVWSLVYQSLTISCLSCAILWISSSWRPRIAFSMDEIRSVWNYSANLTGYSIMNYFSRNADYLIIGRFLGAQDLGYYTLAYKIMLYPVQSISQIIGKVLFPVFSIVQDDNERLKRIFLKVCSAIAMVTFPLMAGLLVCADLFIPYVFGDQWRSVIVIVMILAPVGLVQSLGTTVGTIYQAKGRTDWLFRWGAGTGLFYIGCFIIGIHWGIVGLAISYAIASFVLAYPNFAIPFYLIELKFTQLMEKVWRQFFCSVIMSLCLLIVKSMMPVDIETATILYLLVFLGVIIYLSLSLLINRPSLHEIRDTFFEKHLKVF